MSRYTIRKYSIAWWTWQAVRLAAAAAVIMILTLDYIY